MNERIKELAEQAREYATTRHPVSNIVLTVNSEKFEEKFAELIVRECMGVARQQRNPANLNYKPSERFVEDLQRHFGVEE